MADYDENDIDDDDHDSGIIRPIEEESVQRIVAGQAVTDLASAVKELVDNALDAGSTSINIRLFNQGLDILEVSDDGSGVPPSSRPFMAMAHATSKIRCFGDIYSTANSLGFRGEALFCLANLSEKLVVSTRTEEEPMAQTMEYQHDGSLNASSVKPTPRKIGTTVAVVKLLSSLPVRRADMERRIGQHRTKMIRMMEGYAIFSVGVRINLMDVDKGKETAILATATNSRKLEQTISSVLGSKFLNTISPLSIDLKEVVDEASPKGDWKLEGFLSNAPSEKNQGGGGGNNNKSAAGASAAKAGQQFFSINGRPVELPKVARTIGDVWRGLGGKKKFSCILTLTMPNQEYDVNLSPEKRQVLLTNEETICQAIRDGVTKFWAGQTEGQFTPNASQPSTTTSSSAAAAAAVAPKSTAPSNSSSSQLKPAPPKINDMESLARIQESNRKRALELHSQVPSIAPATSKKRAHEDEMDVDSQYGDDADDDDDDGDGEDDDQPAARRAYIRRFKEEQKEQRKLNASQEGASCQYGEDHPGLQQDQQAAAAGAAGGATPSGESPRVRRRGGFVHDISTAKQWERDSSSVDKGFKIPPGIEDPDAEEEEEEDAKASAKRQRIDPQMRAGRASPVRPAARNNLKMSTKDAAAAAAASCFDLEEDEAAEQGSSPSRRVTLSLNNEPTSTTAEDEAKNNKDPSTGSSDTDKVLWMEAQARFNQRGQTNPEKEIDVLVKSSVSPKEAALLGGPSHRNKATTNNTTNRPQALNLEQFAFGKVDSNNNNNNKKVAQPNASAKAVKPAASSPEAGSNGSSQNDVRKEHNKRSESATVSTQSTRAAATTSRVDSRTQHEESDDDATTPEAEVRCDVVWNGFSGTDDVIAMAKSARQRLLDRKRKLKEVRSEDSSDQEEEDEEGKEGTTARSKRKPQKVTLSKQDFAKMTVLGQFNLGFIVAISNSTSDLWILDQHACDERRNFERLMTETVLHNQKLIAPMPIELDPWEESCVIQNRELFRKNGFQFQYDESKPPRHRLSLTALPHSGARDGRKAVTYGPEDVSALCSILGARGNAGMDDEDDDDHVSGGTGVDGSGKYGNNSVRRYAGSLSSQVGDDADKIITRLPKAIAMFASRACRGSIMIGTALSRKEMEKVLSRMEGLSDPWNCAHGRPTTTHVSNLHSALLNDERKVAERISGPTLAASTSLSQSEEDHMD